MESHVSGDITPLSLGKLRRDLLAILIGNSLFTQVEQLQANHQAHECECPQRLVLWLRNVQREAERRQRVIATQAQACQQVSGYDKQAQTDELQQLAQCSALTRVERNSIHLLPTWDVSRLEATNLVGLYYVKVLRRTGKLREYGA